MSQSPLVGASGPAFFDEYQDSNPVIVSIPSGRGFWAGSTFHSKRYSRCQSQSPLVGASGPANTSKTGDVSRTMSQSPLVGASGPAYEQHLSRTATLGSQSPLVGASGPAVWPRLYPVRPDPVSIPSGRGFWAGKDVGIAAHIKTIVSIPSGRGFWAGYLQFDP